MGSRNQYYREYYQRNKERMHERSRIWQRANPDKVYLYDIKRLYGLSKEDFEELNKECSICGSRDKLVVDHDHATDKVRNRLCPDCNKGLGYFKDNSLFLSNAISYLEKYNGI